MSTSPYSVFIGADPSVVDVDPSATMAQVRQALGSSMSSTDRFLYNNQTTGLKTVLEPVSAEQHALLSGCHFPSVPSQGVDNPIVQVVSTSTSSPSFMGTQPADGFLRNNDLFGVRIRLNQTDAAAITANQGKFQPVMLANVESCNPDNPANFTYCVICEKGAIVEFDLSSWGAAGWGYSITSSMHESTDICGDPLYITYDGSAGSPFDRQCQTVLRRYNSKAGDTIQIQANAALGIAKEFNVQYSTITFNGWNISQWKRGGNTYTSNTPIPAMAHAEAEFMELAKRQPRALTDHGFQPGPPAGGSSVPGGTTQPGTPTAGPPSGQQFGQPIYDIKPGGIPVTRSQGLIASLEVFFLVFDSHEDATAVIKVLNSGTMGFGN